jgi:hypothetical protein
MSLHPSLAGEGSVLSHVCHGRPHSTQVGVIPGHLRVLVVEPAEAVIKALGLA